MKPRCWLLFPLLLFASVVSAQRIGTPEPEPFRRDEEISGRDFEYNEESFLHRFSYRFRPEAVRRWFRTSEGFRGTVGSVRSDEFYVFEELRKTISLEDPVYFVFRHKRDEDFDGRYDRTLTGLGLSFADGWYGTALAELVGEKEDIDAQVELSHVADWGGVRAALVLVDVALNSKSDGEEYEQKPFTYYLEGLWRSSEGLELSGWLNINPHTRLTDDIGAFGFVYDQYSAEINLRAPLTEDWRVWLSLGGETGERDLEPFDPTSSLDSNLTRKHFQVTGQLEHDIREDVTVWFGARYFHLHERDRRPVDPTLDGELRARESMVYGGVAYRLHERVVVWPSLFLQWVDNEEDFPLDPMRDDTEDGFVGKAILPIEVWLSKATATLNLGLLLHEPRFGGGNVQLQIPF